MAERSTPSFRDDFYAHEAQQRDFDARGYDAYAPQDYEPQDYPPQDYPPQEFYPADEQQAAYAPPRMAAPAAVPAMFAQRAQPRAPQMPRQNAQGPFAPAYPQVQPNYAQPNYTQPNYAQPNYAQPNYAQPEYSGAPFAAPRVNLDRLTHWAGAICSAVFVLGAVLWGYDLAVRDVRGIPVVRASAGPLRIAPEVPGGEISANQGLAVNAIAALGSAAPLPDEVTLAPQPVDLAAEDVSPAAPMADAPLLADLPNALPEDMPISDEAAVEAALTMALSEGGEAPAEITAQDAGDMAAPALSEPVTMSNTDAAQPVQMDDAAPLIDAPQTDAALDPSLAQPTAPPTAEVDAATIPAGTKMVQLGAFDDDATARAEWANLQTRFADLMGSKALVVQQASSGGRNFYRLRAHGFESEDETRRFCAALLAENASCIPVAQR